MSASSSTPFNHQRKSRRLSLQQGALWGTLLLLAAIVVSVGLGPIGLSPMAVLHVLGHQLFGMGDAPSRLETSVVMNLRLPRVLFGALSGAALAVSGAALQSLFRNPLTDPGIIGVSSGAAAAAVGAMVLLPPMSIGLNAWVVPLAAFMGGLVATTLIYVLARPSQVPGTSRLLLVGIAVGSALAALTGFFTFIANDTQLHSVVFWQMGSLGSINWQQLAVAAPLILIALSVVTLIAPRLDLLTLGERQARHLGLNVNRTRTLLIAMTALLTGTSVAFSGAIGFVGLVIPHIVRFLCGPKHRVLVPMSGLAGAILIVVADTLSRTIAPPAEVPIGLFTAAMGAPFFLCLILKSKSVRL